MAETKKDPVHRETYATEFIKGDWDRAQYLDSPHMDNMMGTLLNLGAEFWALKRRLLVLEKFMDEKKVATRDAVEAYTPTDGEKAAWMAERDDFVNRVFGILTRPAVRVGGPVPTTKVPPLNKG